MILCQGHKNAGMKKSAFHNGCRICVDIMTGEKLPSVKVAIFPVIFWSSRWGRNGVRCGMGEIVI